MKKYIKMHLLGYLVFGLVLYASVTSMDNYPTWCSVGLVFSPICLVLLTIHYRKEVKAS